jgi:hypothetical protein
MLLLRNVVLAILAGALAPHPAPAQEIAPSALDVLAGSELENYLRALQVAGIVKPYPWSVRGFSSRETVALAPPDTALHPWKISDQRLRSRFAAGASFSSAFNSSFPYGGNDGALWAGRGLTIGATAGVVLRAGPLSVVAAPVAFVSQNSSFRLLDNGRSGNAAFNDGRFPLTVDRPQRFGDGSYGRLDLGASGVRLDTRALTVGAGTFPMWWGPAVEHPFVLGNNAPGIPHLFIGTGDPVNVFIGRIHARAVWGQLEQSAYSPVTGSDRYLSRRDPGRRRLMSGMVLLFTPRPVPDLELGVTRFVHVPFRPEGAGAEFWRSPWPVFLKKNLPPDPDGSSFTADWNELASVFARWVFPAAGLELYGEHGHDDWYHDLRDLAQEPDHNKGYVIGFQKTFRTNESTLSTLRGEIANYQASPLARDRPGQGAIYTHSSLRQGHTHRGQLLGSWAGVGSAAASVLAWDRYTRRGRTTIAWRRILRAETGTYHLSGLEDLRSNDVLHTLGVERSMSFGPARLNAGFELMRNFNRDFERDVFNLNLLAGVQWSPGTRGDQVR